MLQRRAQAKLDSQDVAWRSQSNQLAALTTDNHRLAALVASDQNSRAASNGQKRELLKLRGEAGLLRSQIQKMTTAEQPPETPEDHIASLKKMYAARVDQLKAWMDANSSLKIPELRRVTDDEWLGAVEISNFQSDTDFARAASSLRNNAQGQVLGELSSALRKYGGENDGQFPTSLAQLQPYLPSPLDQDILQRYEIVPASCLVPQLQPGGDWAITETAPADPALDMRSAVGLTNTLNADERITNRWTFTP